MPTFITEVIGVFSIHFTVKAMYITNKMEHFSFKSGCAMLVAKLI